ncbi:MAG: lipase family protein [Saprospirales bacterium]|nr:lipase family protein [Saprospirales bacterium]
MPAPTEKAIQQSLDNLQNGLPVLQTDFSHIAWNFALQPDQDQFLEQVFDRNKKLTETLVIFRKRLTEAAAANQDVEPVIDQAFLHYIINTDGQIPEPEDADPFDVYEAVTRYAESIAVGVIKEADGALFLEVDEKKNPFPEWTPGVSAAGMLRRLGRVINKTRYGRDDIIPSHAFGFDESVEDHTLPNAMTLADFSHLAYFGPAYVEKQLKLWGYEIFQWVENEETDTQAFITGKGSHLIVCFRGTSSGADALVDARFFKTNAFGGRGRVHKGFQGALDSVWNQLKDAVDSLGPTKKLFICGHSLGAALAELAAHRFALGEYQVAGVYVYGSPRVGNRDFMDAYNELLEEKTFLHINNKDIVATIPPRILGFNHLGGSPRQFNEGHAITMIPKSRGIFEEEEVEMDFEELDQATQEAIMAEMKEAQQCMEDYTQSLTADITMQEEPTARGLFDNIAPVNDHSMDLYLYKLGCAIIDGYIQPMP